MGIQISVLSPAHTTDLMDYQGENRNQEMKKNQRMTLMIGLTI